ncbi:MAG: hypothetical protein ACKVZ6_15960 [Kineosporiaceae bacterium]
MTASGRAGVPEIPEVPHGVREGGTDDAAESTVTVLVAMVANLAIALARPSAHS